MNFPMFATVAALSAALPAVAGDIPIVVEPSYISNLVSQAIATHPKVEAARARAEAARSAIASIRTWEDPIAGFGITAARKSMRMDEGDLRFMLEQPLPRRGLVRAEKGRASAELQIQTSETGVTSTELGLAVAQVVVELALMDDTLALQQQEIDWVKTIVGTALDRAKNPDSTAVESLRLESELALLTQKFDSAKRQRKQRAQSLNLLLVRNATAEWPVISLPSKSSATVDAVRLRQQMELRNPRLLALRHAIEAAQAETQSAREKQKPSVSLGLESNAYSGGDIRDAMVQVKVSLPWFNKKGYRADISRSEQLQLAARKDLEAELLEFSAQINELITTAENSSKLAAAYESEVVPKTEKALGAIQNAWISSKTTLLEVLEARRSLLTARQELKEASASCLIAQQRLAAISGAFTTSIQKKP